MVVATSVLLFVYRLGEYIRSILAGVDLGITFQILGKDLECPDRMTVAAVDGTEYSVAGPCDRLVGFEDVNQKVNDLLVFGSPQPIFETEFASTCVLCEATSRVVVVVAETVVTVPTVMHLTFGIGIRESELTNEHVRRFPERSHLARAIWFRWVNTLLFFHFRHEGSPMFESTVQIILYIVYNNMSTVMK